jgi:hypothetical protein
MVAASAAPAHAPVAAYEPVDGIYVSFPSGPVAEGGFLSFQARSDVYDMAESGIRFYAAGDGAPDFERSISYLSHWKGPLTPGGSVTYTVAGVSEDFYITFHHEDLVPVWGSPAPPAAAAQAPPQDAGFPPWSIAAALALSALLAGLSVHAARMSLAARRIDDLRRG